MAVAPPAKRYDTIVYVPDCHCGDQDNRAIELAVKVIKYVKPDQVIQLGDFVDFYGLSSFEAGSSSPAMRLQRELDIAHDVLGAIRDASPSSVRSMIEGNHEARLGKWLKKQPAFQGLRALNLSHLLKLGEFGWDGLIYDRILLNNGQFMVKHGDFVANDSGQSAKKELFANLTSGVSGHCHRIGQFTYRSHAGLLSWTEAGHLQNNPPSWKQNTQNWCQGVVVGEHEISGNAFHITPVPFRLSYKTTLHGKEIS